MCDHVWIFEARTLSHAASPATMRHVRCQGSENRAHRHANFGLAGWRPEGCSSRSTRNSCLKAGRDGAVR
jgi:hypothetical protein